VEDEHEDEYKDLLTAFCVPLSVLYRHATSELVRAELIERLAH